MAPLLSNLRIDSQRTLLANTYQGDSDGSIDLSDQERNSAQDPIKEPALFHKVKNQRSILALVVSDSKIYAGTQGGELLVSQWRP